MNPDELDEIGDGGPYRTPGRRSDEGPESGWPVLEPATGSYLDALAWNLGVKRLFEEPDDELRDRVQLAMFVRGR